VIDTQGWPIIGTGFLSNCANVCASKLSFGRFECNELNTAQVCRLLLNISLVRYSRYSTYDVIIDVTGKISKDNKILIVNLRQKRECVAKKISKKFSNKQ